MQNNTPKIITFQTHKLDKNLNVDNTIYWRGNGNFPPVKVGKYKLV
jgi:hypothetical protein